MKKTYYSLQAKIAYCKVANSLLLYVALKRQDKAVASRE